MSEGTPIRRVVVVLDGAERTFTVVREATRVASRLGAELQALLLEDEQLLRLAGLGFAKPSRRLGGDRYAEDDLEREWRAVAHAVRLELRREAEAQRVRASFAVQRGRVGEALEERLQAGDLVVVGWGGWSPRAGQSAPIRVIWDGTGSAERALEVGAQLAGPEGQLLVWIVPDHDVLERARDHVVERVAGRVGQLVLAPLPNDLPATIRGAVGAMPGGLLVVPAEGELARRLSERSAAARFPCGVLVVRR